MSYYFEVIYFVFSFASPNNIMEAAVNTCYSLPKLYEMQDELVAVIRSKCKLSDRRKLVTDLQPVRERPILKVELVFDIRALSSYLHISSVELSKHEGYYESVDENEEILRALESHLAEDLTCLKLSISVFNCFHDF